MKRKFVSGVVEGFYGRPWSSSQRLDLFQRLEYMGLNTYLYAPKDDLKHRQMWRDLYSKEETIQLKYLIDSSKKHNIIFVYAISPGVDITFSNTNDIFLLKQKMHQVMELGCEAFALLFDDIFPSLRDIDKNSFHSLANAQVTITNDIYDSLKQPSFFLFCPTEYCATRAIPSVSKSEYLTTIGMTLKPEIDIMWTGPKVIAKFITLQSILELCEVLKRQPIIWDNIHANDYDQKRLFLGPYCGRSSKLIPHIRGILTNPNCEFEANFIAIHTLAQWVKSSSEDDNQQKKYIPSEALRLALLDWLDVLYKNKDSFNEYRGSISSTSVNDGLSQATIISLPPPISSVLCDGNNIFCPEKLSPTTNISSTIGTIISASSTQLSSPDSSGSALKEAMTSDKIDSLPPAINIVEITKGDTIKDSSLTFDTNISESLSNQNEMEIIDGSLNSFLLIPMEIEDNPSDTDNALDPMAMQVDIIEEGHIETMDAIDEENSTKTYRINKELISSQSFESEMDNTISNESVDLADTILFNKMPKLTIDDLNLLVHLFFLPYEHGPLAVKMLELIHWIRSHAHLVDKRHVKSIDDAMNSNINGKRVEYDNSEDQDHLLKSLEWHIKAKEFEHQVELVRNLVDRMCNIPNRSVLFDLYPYIQDLRHVLGTLSSYIKWMDDADISYENVCALRRLLSWCTPGYKESFMSDDHEPWMFRGGLISEFQRMFPLEGSNDLFPNRTSFLMYPPKCGTSLFESSMDDTTDQSHFVSSNEDVHITNNVGIESLPIQPSMFMMRPYYSSDKDHLYNLCHKLLYNQLIKNPELDQSKLSELSLTSLKDLAGDRYLGYFIEFCPESCMVLENDRGDILGYALGSSTVKEILQFRQNIYSEKMKIKYASKINSFSETDVSPSKPQSVVKTLIDGFFTESNYSNFPEIKDRPYALIHLDIMDGCKETDLDTIDTLSRRLLVCMCSALKTRSAQTLNIAGDIEPSLQDLSISQEVIQNEHHHPQEITATPNVQIINRPLNLSMAIYCEVDSLNKSYEDFYRRCGFMKCNIDNSLNSISIMSRYV